MVGKHVHLMLENEANQARYLERSNGRAKLYNAQWGDDFHNALHVLLTGEEEGYYSAFADEPLHHLARTHRRLRVFREKPFRFTTSHAASQVRTCHPRQRFSLRKITISSATAHSVSVSPNSSDSKSSGKVWPWCFSVRIFHFFSWARKPQRRPPFLFFCDWQGEAAELTREGRRKEFVHFKTFATPEMRDKIPDPCDESTFLASKLDWAKIEHAPISRNFHELTKELLRLREQKIVPLIKDHIVAAKAEVLGKGGRQGGLDVRWQTAKGDELQITTNFCKESLPMPRLVDGETIWRSSHSSDTALRPDQIVVRRSLMNPRAKLP